MEKKKASEKVTEKQGRRGRPSTGHTQTMINFRCDNENVAYIRSKSNWGRWLNKLIERARQEESEADDCADMPPELDDELK